MIRVNVIYTYSTYIHKSFKTQKIVVITPRDFYSNVHCTVYVATYEIRVYIYIDKIFLNLYLQKIYIIHILACKQNYIVIIIFKHHVLH